MEASEEQLVTTFFASVREAFPIHAQVSTLLITHMLAGRPAFVRAVAASTDIRSVLPKPRSINREAVREVSSISPVDNLSREAFENADHVLQLVEHRAGGKDLILLDVGGYFAATLPQLIDGFSGQILGVVETTENGYRRYARVEKPPCPIFSVARSPLKVPEDYLVGQSIVFSVEALIRARGDIIQGKGACVIGYGKLGSSIARGLHSRGLAVTIYDEDPVILTQAMANGYRIAGSRLSALSVADVIICATGNMAMRREDFSAIRPGAYVASVTSSDDELDLPHRSEYARASVADHVTKFSAGTHYFYVLGDGNAVNFVHGASVGPYIHLVHAELIAAVARLSQTPLEHGLCELDSQARREIAKLWLAHFSEGAASSQRKSNGDFPERAACNAGAVQRSS